MQAAFFTRIMHTRGFGLGVGIIAFLAACFYFFGGYAENIPGDRGLALPSANEWFANPYVDFGAAMGGAVAAMIILLLLNKVHNVLRSMTSVYIAFFGAMMAATANLFVQFYTGTVLLIIVALSLLLILGCYRDVKATPRVYLIFLLLSGFAATQYCFIFYLPVFLIACAQMRIFNGRTFVAAMLGIITPWWIMLGFGIITLSDIHLPQLISVFAGIGPEDTVLLLITVGLTALLFLTALVLNLMKAIAYNARSRAVNGVISITALATIVAMGADYRNLIAYVPLLDFFAALQAAHYLSTHRVDKSYIIIAVILVIYAALFVCQTVM